MNPILILIIGIAAGIGIARLQRTISEGETIYEQKTDHGMIRYVRPRSGKWNG